MIYLRSPNRAPVEDPSVFLAGGITSCRDWQRDLVAMLKDTDLTVINPRREQWEVNLYVQDIAREQIEWEHEYLSKATAISFWFAEETLQPITLFELGKWFNAPQPIFIGIHPDYRRKFDVECQVGLETNRIEIVYSLDELAKQIKDWAHAY